MRAPIARQIWMAAVPTPDAPACTSAVWPGCKPPCNTSASHAVMNTSGIAAASASAMPRGVRMACAAGIVRYSAYAPPDTMPITWSPGFQRDARRCARSGDDAGSTTSPANSMPGMSCAPGNGFGYNPRRCSKSARLSAVACTRTNTSSAAGTGTGTSATRNTCGSPNSVSTTARITPWPSSPAGDGRWQRGTLRWSTTWCLC